MSLVKSMKTLKIKLTRKHDQVLTTDCGPNFTPKYVDFTKLADVLFEHFDSKPAASAIIPTQKLSFPWFFCNNCDFIFTISLDTGFIITYHSSKVFAIIFTDTMPFWTNNERLILNGCSRRASLSTSISRRRLSPWSTTTRWLQTFTAVIVSTTCQLMSCQDATGRATENLSWGTLTLGQYNL